MEAINECFFGTDDLSIKMEILALTSVTLRITVNQTVQQSSLRVGITFPTPQLFRHGALVVVKQFTLKVTQSNNIKR